METKIRFGQLESVALLVNTICTQIFLNYARIAAETAGTASWILALYISILAFGCFYLIAKLYTPFNGKDLLDVGELVGGNIGRIIVGSTILTFLIFITSITLREYSEDMKIIIFTVSPISFVSLFFILGMILGAYFGIEAILRFHALVLPIIVVGYIIIITAVLPFADYTNFLPILGNGAVNIFGNGFLKLSVFSEFLLIFLIVPFIKTNKNFKKIGFTAIGVSTLLLLLSSITFISVIPYPISTENFLPIFQMARLINYGRFFQRIESLFVLIWAASALLYLSSCFFFTIHVFKKTFKLEYHRPLIIPFAIIIFALSLLPPNLMSAVEWETKYFRNFSWVVTFGLTILLLLIARAVNQRNEKEVKE